MGGASCQNIKGNCSIFRDFPQGLKMMVSGTPICGVKGSFNKI